MKFPITREELQRFDYTIEMKQKRERDIDNKIEDILQRLCKDFEKFIQTSSHEKKFVWAQVQKGENSAFSEISNFIRHYHQIVGNGIAGGDHVEKEVLIDSKKKLLLDKIRKLFIGCDIILDPLHTYIIIDWS